MMLAERESYQLDRREPVDVDDQSKWQEDIESDETTHRDDFTHPAVRLDV